MASDEVVTEHPHIIYQVNNKFKYHHCHQKIVITVLVAQLVSLCVSFT